MNHWLRQAPFLLDDAAVLWVENTLATMDVRQRLGQLMCVYLRGDDPSEWLDSLAEKGVNPGGLLVLSRGDATIGDRLARVQAHLDTPLLVAANLEAGMMGSDAGPEAFANPMQLAATRDPGAARLLAIHCARSANAMGVNWAFAPVVDIAFNPVNPITNTRTFGADPATVSQFAVEYVAELESRGIATSPKHFPGDGVDGRDQHLVTTSNDLDAQTWRETFGAVYRSIVGAGARTIMAGHIRQPALSRELVPGIADDQLMPATLASELLTGVLREELGFEGLVVSDNSAMTGITAITGRSDALPRMINAGVDMILGNLDVEGDMEILTDAVNRGTITAARLDEAVRRVLAVKASIGLHRETDRRQREQPVPEEEASWRDRIARQAVTLVKDTQGLLPLRAEHHRRALVYSVENAPTFYDPTPSLLGRLVAGLQEHGLEVEVRPVPGNSTTPAEAAVLHEKFDVCIYYVDLRFTGNSNQIRLVWSPWQGHDAPRHVATLPTLLLAMSDPYVLQDVPMIRTAINCYTPTSASIDAAIEILFGEREATGASPIDPFVGRWDARL